MPTDRALFKQIVATYAAAMLEAADATGDADAVGAQLAQVVRTVRGHTDLRTVLLNEAVGVEQRVTLAREIFSGFSPIVLSVVELMLERGEMDTLSAVSESYTRISEEKRNIAFVDVTTAMELNDALRASIKSKMSADLGKDVVLRERIDPAIVGGIIIDAAGRRIDASIVSQLERARVALSNAHTGGDA